MPSRELKIEILGDAASLLAALRSSGRELDKFGNSASSSKKKADGLGHTIGHGLKIAGLAAIPVVGLVAYQLKGAADAAAEAQSANILLTNSMRKYGLFGHGMIKSVEEQNAAFAAQYGFLESDVTPAFTKLIQATGNVSEAQMLLAKSADLARARGMDLSSTSLLLSKLWEGNTTSLKRLGIAVPTVTTAEDKLAKSTKTVTQAQKDAAKKTDELKTRQVQLAALQHTFGGDAAKYAKTASGSLDRLNSAYDQLKITIGTALLPVIVGLANKVSVWIQHAQKTGEINRLVKEAQHDFVVLGGAISKAAGWVETLYNWVVKAKNAVDSLNVGVAGIHLSDLANPVGSLLNHIPGGLATGGPALPGHVYHIGEDGPETLVMGQRGGYVIPQSTGGGRSSSLTVNQYITVPQADPRALQAEAAWQFRRLAVHGTA